MPRVSEVLDYFKPPYLIAWELRVGKVKAEEIRQAALRVGSAVDLYVYNNVWEKDQPKVELEGEELEQFNNCTKAWSNFIKDHPEFYAKAKKFKANMQKELVLGDLVGHPDFIFDDELPDLKTSKSISKSHWMQTAQYARMYDCSKCEWSYEKPINGIKRISILRLDKNEAGVYEYKVLEEPFITFWQEKFQARYEAYKEDEEYNAMIREKLENSL